MEMSNEALLAIGSVAVVGMGRGSRGKDYPVAGPAQARSRLTARPRRFLAYHHARPPLLSSVPVVAPRRGGRRRSARVRRQVTAIACLRTSGRGPDHLTAVRASCAFRPSPSATGRPHVHHRRAAQGQRELRRAPSTAETCPCRPRADSRSSPAWTPGSSPPGRFGLEEGDAHVIRNAGGRARDALRSLIISQRLLGTREIAVIHHTDCGMLTFSNRDLRTKVKEDLGQDTGEFDFLPFQDLDEQRARGRRVPPGHAAARPGDGDPGIRVRRADGTAAGGAESRATLGSATGGAPRRGSSPGPGPGSRGGAGSAPSP